MSSQRRREWTLYDTIYDVANPKISDAIGYDLRIGLGYNSIEDLIPSLEHGAIGRRNF
jgi:hypothetical protein